MIKADDGNLYIFPNFVDDRDVLVRVGAYVHFVDGGRLPRGIDSIVTPQFFGTYLWAPNLEIVESPPPIFVDTNAIAFDLELVRSNCIDGLKGFRDKYPTRAYPEELVQLIFSELYAIEWFWRGLELFFQEDRDSSDFIESYRGVSKTFTSYRDNWVSQDPNDYLSSDRTVANTSYKDWKDTVVKATNGDNLSVCLIEYSYWYFHQNIECILAWAACGCLGLSSEESMRVLSKNEFDSIPKYDLFELFLFLSKTFSLQAIPPHPLQYIIENEPFQIPEAFSKLTSYWGEKFNSH